MCDLFSHTAITLYEIILCDIAEVASYVIWGKAAKFLMSLRKAF